jgi:hypothetical protein
MRTLPHHKAKELIELFNSLTKQENAEQMALTY